MKTSKRKTGDLGEKATACFLFLHGYRICERNWFYYRKEVDLIARRFGTLVFCEVKTRTMAPDEPSPYGFPADAVDAEKRKNLVIAARAYARLAHWNGKIRMDIMEVYLRRTVSGKQRIVKLRHIKNAFPA